MVLRDRESCYEGGWMEVMVGQCKVEGIEMCLNSRGMGFEVFGEYLFLRGGWC